MKHAPSIIAMLAAMGVVSAQTITTSVGAFNAGRDFTNTGEDVMGGKVNGTTGSNVLPYYSTMTPEAVNFQEGRNPIGGAGMSKQIQCEMYKAPNAFQQQECDAVNFMSKSPTQRLKFAVDKQTDPILTGSKGVINDPSSIPGASARQYCMGRVKNPAAYITETYTETQTLENLSCKCVLKVTCDPERDGCDQGGIVPNSWADDMVTSFALDGTGNYILQFGVIADNYWGGWGAMYDRNLTFNIYDVGLITRFALIRAASDDWLMVKANDNLVYVDPRDGNRLEVYSPPPVFESSNTCSYTQAQDDWGGSWQYSGMGGGGWQGDGSGGNVVSYQSCTAVGGSWNCITNDYRIGMVRYCATCFSGPELSTNWSFGLNIDVKPYLKNGSNTIFTRTTVAGDRGEAIQLTTHQLCPYSCYDQWSNGQCAPLGQRT